MNNNEFLFYFCVIAHESHFVLLTYSLLRDLNEANFIFWRVTELKVKFKLPTTLFIT